MADAQASGACYGNIVWVQVPSPPFWKRMRKCRNWQTSKTKDLVLVTACGFKSHLPHEKGNRQIPFFLSVILFSLLLFCREAEDHGTVAQPG